MMGHHHVTISFLSFFLLLKSCWIINVKVKVEVDVDLIIILGGNFYSQIQLLQSNTTLTKAVQNCITKGVIKVMSIWSWFVNLFHI